MRPDVAEDDQARRNLRIFLNERMGGAKTQRDGVAPHHKHGEHKIGFGLMAHSRSRRRAMQHASLRVRAPPLELRVICFCPDLAPGALPSSRPWDSGVRPAPPSPSSPPR